jgi:D-alanyl-D-alanine carboxypeptidase
MLALAASVSAAPAAPAPAVSPLPVRLDRELHQFARAHPAFPGLAIAVRAPGFAWSGAAGVADRASRKPLTPAAPFRIASVTKTFTAAAVLRLVENGKLGLNDPIARHLSASTVALLRHGGYDVDAIRVGNLLQHTSGIYDYAGDQSFQAYVVGHPHHHWTRTEQLRFAVNHGKPLFAPGSAFHYSDTGYILLGEILERETGRNLAAAYRSLLGFDRLGLHHTYLETLEPAPTHTAARAHQYLGTIDTARFDPSFDLYGGGGLVSTVDDLARFYRALLSGHLYENAATLRMMLGKPGSNHLTDLGMGIFAESVGRETCWHHDGFWGTAVLHCPHTGITIAITVNQAQGFDTALQQLEPELLRLISRN